MKERKKLHYLVMSALWAAIIFLAIFLIKIPLANGYANIGDSLIFLSSLFLPLPFSIGASAVGAALADILSGYVVYAPFTFVIKGLMALLFFFLRKGKNYKGKNWVNSIACGALGACLYLLTDYILYGAGAVASIPGNIGQCTVSAVVYVALAHIMEYKFKIKK